MIGTETDASEIQRLKPLRFFELASVLVRLDHVASFIVNAHRGDGKRFVVHADEKLSAFVELELAKRV